MSSNRSEWCERLERALADGRFLEDPAFYRPHVVSCERCRGPVEGLMILQDLIARARHEVPVEDLDTSKAEEVVRAAVEGNRVYLRKRNTGIGLCILVLLVGGGLLLGLRHPANPPRSPVAYAESLHRAVFPRGAPPRYDLLGSDSALRARFLEALDDPSSLVRRTALHALTMSSIPLPRDAFELVLSHASEDLETPLEVAGVGDSSRWITDALEIRRTATLVTVLSGLAVESSTRGSAVSAQLLLPFLGHRDVEVRKHALFALSSDKGYSPGTELERLMKADPSAQVREKAAALLLDRGGEAGASAVVTYLREASDWSVEQALTPKFTAFQVTRELSAGRVADLTTPTLVALAHARALWRAGVTAPPTRLIDRVLAEADPAAWAAVASLASGAQWSTYRAPLQERWTKAAGTPRQDLAVRLAEWDLRSGDEARFLLALEICRAHRGLSLLLPHLESLAASSFPGVREEAQVLLNTWPRK